MFPWSSESQGATEKLLRAIEEGDAAAVRAMLENGDVDANAPDHLSGKTPLHEASVHGHVEIVKMLLMANANPNASDKDGNTPLHDASMHGNAKYMNALLKASANSNAGEKGRSMKKVEADHGLSVRLCGRDEDEKRQQLLEAINANDVAAVRNLLRKGGVAVNDRDTQGRTPLHWSISHGDFHVIQFLLKTGADPNIADKNDTTPLHLASGKGRVDIVELLLEFSSDPKATDANGETALHKASREGHAQVVDVLLKAKANHNAASKVQKETALHSASSRGHLQVIKILLETGTELCAVDSYGQTPLHKASKGGHLRAVEYLVKAMADPKSKEQSSK